MNIVYLPTEQIKTAWLPNINPDDFERLVESIKEYGILEPLIVVKEIKEKSEGLTYKLIHGYQRFYAARKLGLVKIPCVIFRDEKLALNTRYELHRCRREVDLEKFSMEPRYIYTVIPELKVFKKIYPATYKFSEFPPDIQQQIYKYFHPWYTKYAEWYNKALEMTKELKKEYKKIVNAEVSLLERIKLLEEKIQAEENNQKEPGKERSVEEEPIKKEILREINFAKALERTKMSREPSLKLVPLTELDYIKEALAYIKGGLNIVRRKKELISKKLTVCNKFRETEVIKEYIKGTIDQIIWKGSTYGESTKIKSLIDRLKTERTNLDNQLAEFIGKLDKQFEVITIAEKNIQ